MSTICKVLTLLTLTIQNFAIRMCLKNCDTQLCRDTWTNSASVLGAGCPHQCSSVSWFLYLVFWTSSVWAWVQRSTCFQPLMNWYSQLAVVGSVSKTCVSKITQLFNLTEYGKGFMVLSHLNRTGFRRLHCSEPELF